MDNSTVIKKKVSSDEGDSTAPAVLYTPPTPTPAKERAYQVRSKVTELESGIDVLKGGKPVEFYSAPRQSLDDTSKHWGSKVPKGLRKVRSRSVRAMAKRTKKAQRRRARA